MLITRHLKEDDVTKWLSRGVKAFLPLLAISFLGVSCTEDTSKRRTAVDAANLCNNDPNKVYAGQCVPLGQRVVAGGEREGEIDAETRRRQEAAAAAEEARLQAETEAARLKAEAEAAAAEARRRADAEAQAEAARLRAEAEAAAVEARRAAAAEAAAAEERRRAEAADEARRRAESPESVRPSAAGEPSPATVTTLTFKKDSFIAIADKVVVSNCFIPAGTKIDFSGDAYKVSQFEKDGVNQTIVFDTVNIVYPSNAAANCALKGRDFVFITAHGEFLKQLP